MGMTNLERALVADNSYWNARATQAESELAEIQIRLQLARSLGDRQSWTILLMAGIMGAMAVSLILTVLGALL